MCIFSLSSCSSDTNASTRNTNSDMNGDEDRELSAWISYWDMDKGIKELSKTADKITSVSVFAVYLKTMVLYIFLRKFPQKMAKSQI